MDTLTYVALSFAIGCGGYMAHLHRKIRELKRYIAYLESNQWNGKT